ncbi:GNAT family N-acetyltransferase [Actinomadura barringtoniae]|uniref:GNAT family N-acetyltransferase n=1 Tax=Actinomadura barringtoniae TaxID=1427535 RepID=A0A939PGJ1_9ACTN|nr:GNAT family protein [Actinomadura barringtoniae]MBO2452105.1 GNAT family N-acetyltransferase [Actinomadura barringtoniae]
MSGAWFERPVLSGRYVRLEPLSLDHVEGLFEAGKDPDIWTWLSDVQPTGVNGMKEIVERALEACEQRVRLPWVQIDAVTGEVAGTTSFYDIDPGHRGLAIGHTWIGPRWHRTGINTESKLMLLERAFGDLGAVRVVWHTHSRNERSRRAIQRLGAEFEGIHRNHRILKDGSLRDTATFSMIDSEWPAAWEALRARLDR